MNCAINDKRSYDHSSIVDNTAPLMSIRQWHSGDTLFTISEITVQSLLATVPSLNYCTTQKYLNIIIITIIIIIIIIIIM